jgi:hypothetical protein
VLNVKPVCRSVGIGDVAADTGFISGVDPQSIATGFVQDVEPSFVKPSSCRNMRRCLGMSVWTIGDTPNYPQDSFHKNLSTSLGLSITDSHSID